MLQAELIAEGGHLNIIDASHPRDRDQYSSSAQHSPEVKYSDDPYLKELAESSNDRSMVTLKRSSKEPTAARPRPALDPTPPRPHETTDDPFGSVRFRGAYDQDQVSRSYEERFQSNEPFSDIRDDAP